MQQPITSARPVPKVWTSNASERQVAAALYDKGYTVLNKGWPDFLAHTQTGEVRLIEVKPSCSRGLRAGQRRIARVLEELGHRVEVVATRCDCGQCPHSDLTLPDGTPLFAAPHEPTGLTVESLSVWQQRQAANATE